MNIGVIQADSTVKTREVTGIMGVTITDIAAQAGVSIATVSHALNKTRYVSPELAKRIEKIAKENGYEGKHAPSNKGLNYKMGRLSEIALVIPNTFSVVYARLISVLSGYVDREGYMLSIYLSNGSREQEKHVITELIANRRIAGIILAPVGSEPKSYTKLITSDIPLICLERTIENSGISSVLSDNVQGIMKGTEHLIKCGHERISLLLENKNLTTVDERKRGYQQALEEYKITYEDRLVVCADLDDGESTKNTIKELIKAINPTAILAGGNTLTLRCLKSIEEMGIECPKDISLVGFGDDDWCELVNPALTTLTQDTEAIGRKAIELLMAKIMGEEGAQEPTILRLPMELTIRKSTQNIARGPFGEKVVYPEDNFLSEDEEKQLRNGDYTVAISFHYTGNEWTRLHEKAMKDTLNGLGVRVLSVTDAHFEPELQNTQLEGLIMQHPDAIIAVPVDEEKTAEKFKEIAKKTKLVLINNMPKGFERDDYSCWISVNERENGQNTAKILKDHFENKKNIKVGLLVHGTPFFATKQRDFFAEQMLRDNCPNIQIVAKRNFYTIENTYNICKRMMEDHPEIDGLYITWERPALQAIRALKEMGRQDVAIATTDLDYEIAGYMARGEMVVGLSSQRPYDQGVAVAVATAGVLLGKCENRCIGVPPYTVMAGNLEKAWKEILKTKMPDFE